MLLLVNNPIIIEKPEREKRKFHRFFVLKGLIYPIERVKIPHLTLGEQQNGWNPLDKRVSAVALVFKMLYGVLYFKIFFSFLLSAFGS